MPAAARAKQRRLSAAPLQFHRRSSKGKKTGEDRRDDLLIVGIGASAGGLEAVTQLLTHLPLDTGLAFVLVQHLDPHHESALTHILSRSTLLPVSEIKHNQPLRANHVYIIPRDTNLSIVQGLLKLEPRERTRTPYRPIDIFFESLAQDRRERAIGVVLSGTANDGTLGLEAIKAEGGITFAQDESAKHNSMPRSAVAAGCVDLVLSPSDIAKEMVRIARHPYVAGRPFELQTRGKTDHVDTTTHQDDDQPLPSGSRGTPSNGARQTRHEADLEKDPATSAEDGYKKILLLLRNHSGVDFSLYRSSTILRRITRRIVLTKQDTPKGYARFLRGNAEELDSLFSDVLISVTSFFRNPKAFEILQRDILPKLLAQREDDPVRCWVLGCSTGQEAYSLAMSFVEAARNTPRARACQIFATDLNEKLLEKARHGLYPKMVAQDISPERLRQFFVEEDGGYRISKVLRDMVVFARQNLLADPPFSRMDLISCRNLLIYLEPSLQQKALPTFHYALRPQGYLLLGASESVGGFTDLFEPVDRKHKIFAKKAAPTPGFHMSARKKQAERAGLERLPPLPIRKISPSDNVEPLENFRGELNAQREADRIVISQFAPPAVLINDALQVLQFRGQTGAYLELPAGKVSFDVLKMAREGLMLPLRAAINKAKRGNKTVRRERVRVRRDGATQTIHLIVLPLKNLRERCFLVLFEEADKTNRHAAPPPPRRKLAAPPRNAKQESRRIAELEAALSETREYLQSMQEQNEAVNEELQATNEEVQSSNEELQSSNEELETSKEELESANEELTTVNEEMVNRNVELHILNSDLLNLQSSAKLAILLLGRDLTIRRFSTQAESQFHLLPTDVGRPISHLRHALVLTDGGDTPLDLETLSAEVIADVREQEREVRDKGGRWYSLRVRPYLTLDNKVDGAVLVMVDIDALKRSEHIVTAARELAENTVETVREPLLVLDHQLRVERANRAFYRVFQVAPAETTGRRIYDLGNRQWDIPRLHELLEQIQPHHTTIEAFQIEHDFEHLGRRTMLLNARCIDDSQHKTEHVLLAIEDVTERTQVETARARLVAIVESSDDALVSKDLRGIIEQAPVGMYVVDGQFRIQQVNSKGLPLFDSVHPLIGRDFTEVITILWGPDVGGQVVDIFRHTLETGERYISPEFSHRRYDLGIEQAYDWETQRVTLPNGQCGVVCYFTDVTERKRAEAELEQRVADRTRELMQLHVRLGALTTDLHLTEQRERRRLAVELHDHLAQLLVLGKLKLSQSKRVTQSVEKRDELIEETDAVLSDALTYTRTLVIDLSPPILHEFGLPAALRWLGEQMQRHGLAVTVQIENDDLSLPEDQAVLLFQSVRELLMNTIKHAQSDSATVRMERQSDVLQIEVRDDGIGLDLATVADTSTVLASKFGLFSIRERMRALHGHLELRSAPGKGTTAKLVLPLSITTVSGAEFSKETVGHLSDNSALSTQHSTLHQQGAKIRVLLVDDHAMVRQGLRTVLDAYPDLEVIGEAWNGEEAVAFVEQLQPSVVVMDINMPKMNGIEATAHIKTRHPEIIVIGLSVNAGGKNETAMKQAGAAKLLTKEAAMDELYQAIQQVQRPSLM